MKIVSNETRIKLLKARKDKDNNNIVRKIERKIRNNK